MATETSPSKWEGKQVTELNGVAASQIWPLLSDFCNVHKWLPTVETCHREDGVKGQPGLIRYCATTKDLLDPSTGAVATKWARERLISMDPVNHVLCYEMLDNNVGFGSYVATVKVVATDGGDCKIEWSYVSDPVDGWKIEDLDSYVSFCLQTMAQNMKSYLENKN